MKEGHEYVSLAQPSASGRERGHRRTPADLAEPEENDGLDEQDDLAAYRRARQRARTRRVATGAAGLLGLAIIWQIVAMLANSIFLPSVTQTIQTFAHYIDRPYPSQGSPLWLDAVVSLRRIMLGFAIGAAAGIVLGAAMSASRVARHLIDPVIEVLRPFRRWRSSRCSSSGSVSASCPRTC